MSDAARIAELQTLIARAEAAVGRMYGARGASAAYADAKDLFSDAIALARALGRADEAEKLEKRLADVKETFRRQF